MRGAACASTGRGMVSHPRSGWRLPRWGGRWTRYRRPPAAISIVAPSRVSSVNAPFIMNFLARAIFVVRVSAVSRRCSHDDVTSVVPKPNDRLQQAMFVAQRTHACGTQQQVSRRSRREPQPAGGEHAEKVTAGKEQRIVASRSHPVQYFIRPCGDLVGRLSTRASVTNEIPAGAFGEDVYTATTFVLAVVPFKQTAIDLRHFREAGQDAGSSGALQRAGPHGSETQPL